MTDGEPPFRLVASERRFEIDELDEITLARSVERVGGPPIPAGSSGTVVAVWGDGEAYEVEFDEPFHVLATVAREAISDHQRAASWRLRRRYRRGSTFLSTS